MPTASETCAVENAHIASLSAQLSEHTSGTTQLTLAIISANPCLDSTAVARLKQSGMLLLRSSTEALSKALEDEQIADAIAWSVAEGGVSSLSLVGHSQSASIPLDAIAPPASASEIARMHNERIEAAKLKLKDDLARFMANTDVRVLVNDGRLSVHALFFLQESSTFLRLDAQNDEFRPLG